MDKCRKCGILFEGVGKLCPDCEAEISEKLDKGRKLFNRHGLGDLDIKYDIDNARYECTNCDGHWISYNGENWIQDIGAMKLSDEYQHNHLREAMEYALNGKRFVKADKGKLQWSLLPFAQLEDVVKVLMMGAEKYTPDNWKKCNDIKRYEDALLRHVISYISGNRTDKESKLSHLAHAICNCLFLMYFDDNNTKACEEEVSNNVESE